MLSLADGSFSPSHRTCIFGWAQHLLTRTGNLCSWIHFPATSCWPPSGFWHWQLHTLICVLKLSGNVSQSTRVKSCAYKTWRKRFVLQPNDTKMCYCYMLGSDKPPYGCRRISRSLQIRAWGWTFLKWCERAKVWRRALHVRLTKQWEKGEKERRLSITVWSGGAIQVNMFLRVLWEKSGLNFNMDLQSESLNDLLHFPVLGPYPHLCFRIFIAVYLIFHQFQWLLLPY
jgi:hypothetical protein